MREKKRDEARICRLFSSRVPLDTGSFNWRRDREGEREKHKMVQKPLSRRGLLSFEPVGSSFEDYRTTEEASFP